MNIQKLPFRNSASGAFLFAAAMIVLTACWTWSCNKTDFEDPQLEEHSADYAFPLFSTTLSMKDLMFKVLNDSLSGDTLVVNPDNTMTLFYTGDVAEKPATDIFSFLSSGFLPVEDTFYYAPFTAPNGVTIRQASLSGEKFRSSLIIYCLYR